MNDETKSIKNFFKLNHIPLSDDWLEMCITWCKEESAGSNYTLDQLQMQVYEQWLLLDLREAPIASLPANVSAAIKLVLPHKYFLQLMHLVDISKPKLWQLQKIRNANALTRVMQQDADVVGTANRMLLLTLTDGVQQIDAMEFKPVRGLSANLKPGTKVRLDGPLTVRRGRVMLEPCNIKVLGGEVDELAVPNALENVLARALNLPENRSPAALVDHFLTVTANETEQPAAIQSVQHNNISRYNQDVPIVNRRPVHNIDAITDDEERRIAEEVEMLLEAEQAFEQPKRTRSKTPELLDDMDFDDCDFDFDRTVTTSREQSRPPPTTNEQVSLLSASDDEVFNDLQIDEYLDKVDRVGQSQPSLPAPMKTNIITIEKLLQNKDNISKGLFKIRAKFKAIVEKLTIVNDEFKMVIVVGDSTGDVSVRVHSDVLSGFAGYCPTAFLAISNNMLGMNENAAATALTAIKNIKEKLLKLDNVINVLVSREEDFPVIMNILS